MGPNSTWCVCFGVGSSLVSPATVYTQDIQSIELGRVQLFKVRSIELTKGMMCIWLVGR